jgi:hypothetical protein
MYNFNNTLKIYKDSNRRAFAQLMIKLLKEVYEPLNRWSKIETEACKTYRAGVIDYDNDEIMWSPLNKVDAHIFVLALILNELEKNGLEPVKNGKLDLNVLFEASEVIKNDFLSENGQFYSDVLALIERSSGPGDKNEESALEYLKNIETRPGKWLRMCPGDERDVFQGIDLIKMLDDGTELSFQVKPFRDVTKDNGIVTVSGIGNAKEYGVDYLVLVGQGKNNGNFLLINNKPEVKGKYSSYIFPENLLVRDSGNIVESFHIFKKIFIL